MTKDREESPQRTQTESEPQDGSTSSAPASTAEGHSPHSQSDEGFWDRASTHHAIFYGLMVVCVLLFASDLLYHKHAHFKFEETIGFHGLFGFAAYLTIVNSAKLLRRFVIRSEDYYDR